MFQAKKTALWAAMTLTLSSFSAFADIAAVDSAFSGGVVQIPNSRPVYTRGSLLAPDNGVYLFGLVDVSGNNYDFSVVKLAADGSIDTNFGSPDHPGEYRADFNHFQDELEALALLPNGDLVLGGYSANTDNTPATWDPHLIKIEVDGDAYEWGTDVSGKLNHVHRLHALANGKLLVLGDYWTYPNGPSNGARVFGALVQLNSDGSIDTSFGDSGRVLFATDANQYIGMGEIAMAVDANNRILIGYSYFNSGRSAALIRLLGNGQIDTSFPAQTLTSTGNILISRALLIDAMDSNAIYWLLEEETAANSNTYRVAKFGANGNRDNNFARSFDNRPVSYNNEFTQMPDGRLMIAGHTPAGDLRISRLGRDGQPDATFATGGYQNLLHSLSTPELAGFHQLDSGNLLLTGYYGSFPDLNMYAMRLQGYDLVPDAMTVPEKVEVAPGSAQYFGPITITGTDGGVVNSSDAAFYLTTEPSCDQSATYSSGDKRFITNDGICLMHVAASTLETRTTSSLRVNDLSVTFSSVTEVPDPNPNAFAFTALDDRTINTRVESNAIIVGGINVSSPISVSNGEYRIDAGSWTQVAGTVQNGNSVSVRHLTSANFSTDNITGLQIGNVTADFVTTTEAEDVVPDDIAFGAVANALVGSSQQSNMVTVVGINTPVPISIAGGEYRLDNGDWTQASGLVLPGQSVVVRHTASAAFATATSTVLSVGTVTATFTSTTEAQDSTPDAFSFASQSGVEKNVTVVSAATTPTGFNTPVAISVTGGEYSIDGGAFTTAAGQLSPGQRVVVRHQSAGAPQTGVSSTVAIGGVSATFTSTTKADAPAGGGGGGSVYWLPVLLLLATRIRNRTTK